MDIGDKLHSVKSDVTITPVLSVLIPAYEYANGVNRILESVPLNCDEIEVIVFDDSTTSDVEVVVQRHAARVTKYVRNIPSLGAVYNWNALLDVAAGAYVLLMHHDEYPADNQFFECLIRRIKLLGVQNSLILIPLLVHTSGSDRLRSSFAPNFVRKYFLGAYPGFLIRRNFVGPTASLVFPRRLAPRFDTNLKWLVDVDFYAHIVRICETTVAAENIAVVSEVLRIDSITNSIKSDLKSIALLEWRLLVERHGDLPGLRPGVSVLLLELVWFAVRSHAITKKVVARWGSL